MPGIFDVLASNGILSMLLGQSQAAPQTGPVLDTGDDTQRMLNRQKAILSGAGSVTNPAPAAPAPVPMIAQAIQEGQTPMAPSGEMAYPNLSAPEVREGAPAPITTAQPESGFNFNNFGKALELAGRGLTIAGSKDPAATYAAFADMDKPKVTALAGGAFSLITKPDGTQQIVKNEDVAKYLSEQSDTKRLFELLKIGYKADADVKAAGQKEATKEQVKNAGDTAATSLSVNELDRIANELEKTDKATGPLLGLVPKMGRDIITPAGAALQDDAERIIQASLRQTLGAQFTEKEGVRFLERAYNPRLDEKENAKRLRQVAKELADIQNNKEAALDYMKKNGTLDGFKPPQSSMPGRAGSGDSDFSSQAKSAFGSYDPDVYEYRMNNGVLQRRKK